jgi:hypothetical protein
MFFKNQENIQMKLTRVLSLVAFALALSACNTVQTPDGKIPADFVGYAQQVMGTYTGEFNGRATQITLKLDGQTPVVSFSNDQGDLLAKDCGSEIGRMTSITTDYVGLSNNEAISSATFEFSPGKCFLEGHEMTFSFDSHQHLDLSVARETRVIHEPGYTNCGQDSMGHVVCYYQPGMDQIETFYVTGHFKKSN